MSSAKIERVEMITKKKNGDGELYRYFCAIVCSDVSGLLPTNMA